MALRSGYKGIKKVGPGLKLSSDGWLKMTGESSMNLDNLQDVDITTPAAEDALVYDGSKWINEKPDSEPTENSVKLVTSGGVYSAIGEAAAGCVDWSSYAKSGVHQLIPYPYMNTTKTENNVTFTDNGDGTVTVSTSDAVTADTFFIFFSEASISRARLLNYHEMKLSGGISSNVFLQFWNTDGNGGIAFSNGDENVVDFTNASASFNFVIVVKSGTTLAEPVTVSPLLRLATDPSSTFAPYAMTNRELTEKKLNVDISFPFVKSLGNNDDLNNITEKKGIYSVMGAPANSPDNASWYLLLVFPITDKYNEYPCRQIIFASSGVYMRTYSGSPVAWSNWKTLTWDS